MALDNNKITHKLQQSVYINDKYLVLTPIVLIFLFFRTRKIVCQQPVDASFCLSSDDSCVKEQLVLIPSSVFEFDPSLLC